MKFRLLSCIFVSLCGIPVLPALAQDKVQSNSASPAAPLQLQDNPTPSTAPAPSLFAPAGQGSATPQQPSVQPPPPSSTNSPSTPEPAAPGPDSGMGSPGQNPPPSDPNSLIPPAIEPEQPSPINSAGNEEKQRQEQKARYYSVKVKADKEDELASLWEKSDKAKSEEAKRQALRKYYDLLAKRMKNIDPTLSDWIDTMHAAYLRRLEQVRVEPTIPVNPPPSLDPSAQSTPSVSPSPSHRKKKRPAATQEPSPSPASSPSPTHKKVKKVPEPAESSPSKKAKTDSSNE